MPDAEVLYSDVKFKKSTGKANGTASPSEETTYAEVKIAKSPQPSLPGGDSRHTCDTNHCDTGSQAASHGRPGVTSERVAVVVLSVLLVIAAAALGYTTYQNMKTTECLVRQKAEYEALKKNCTDRKCEVKPCIPQPTCPASGSCWKCKDGWERHGEKCYSFSTTKSTWNKSRDECSGGRGDLVKIDSTEEQTFLDMRLRDKMTEAEDKFWIGLTDSEREGTWLWADGSPLNPSLVFWSNDEPDNWDGDNSDGEDCVRMGERGGAVEHKSWFDKSCEIPHKYICEKPAETGEIKCT
ncbi:C-type lectin domain family 4 member D-like [Labrus mixtus]|uniref:C-type lectin domain family 4 member D-like n=1 Tax=Labrus mixtus TaxID=508554 RepID=UPI0029C06DB0|nr:C-type lectin domain family 4 member D-like [Labrus mixtus]